MSAADGKYEYTLLLYEKALPDELPMERKLEAAARCGFDGIELCIDQNPARAARLDWDGKARGELARVLRGSGLRATVSLSALRDCPLGLPDDASNDRAFNMLAKGLEFCCAVGATLMLINGYDVYDQPSTGVTRARFGGNLAKAAVMAERSGVTLGLENAEKVFIDSFAKAAHWVKLIGSPHLGVYGDVGNSCNAMNGDTVKMLRDIQSASGLVCAAHLKDTLPGEYRYTRYGQGHVDFAAAVSALKGMGVRSFTAELFRWPGLDWMAESARVNKFLRGYFN